MTKKIHEKSIYTIGILVFLILIQHTISLTGSHHLIFEFILNTAVLFLYIYFLNQFIRTFTFYLKTENIRRPTIILGVSYSIMLITTQIMMFINGSSANADFTNL